MRRLTPSESRFLIRFGLSQLAKSLLRDIQLHRPKRDVALDIAADRICERFNRHEVHAPDRSSRTGDWRQMKSVELIHLGQPTLVNDCLRSNAEKRG